MELSGEYTFDGPRETVWAYLQDPNALTKVLPGCEELKEIGENAYEGALKIKVGPIQGKFQGTIRLLNIAPPESYDLEVSGQGAPGFVKGSGGLRLEAQGDKTRMTYQGQAQIGGRIANVGQRLVESSAKAIIRQSLDALNELIKLSTTPGEAPQPPAAPRGHPPAGRGGEEQPPDAESGGEEQSAAAAVDQGADHTTAATLDRGEDLPSPGGGGAGGGVSQAGAGVRPGAAIPPGYTPPSQQRMALQVAADVARDIVPERLYPVVAGAAGGALVLALYLLVKQLVGARD